MSSCFLFKYLFQSFLLCSCSFTLDLKAAAHALALFSLFKEVRGEGSDFSAESIGFFHLAVPLTELTGRVQAGEGKVLLKFLGNISCAVYLVLSSQALIFSTWITVTINNLHKFQRALFALLNLLNDLDSDIKNSSRRWENLFIPKPGKQFCWYSDRASPAIEKNAVLHRYAGKKKNPK